MTREPAELVRRLVDALNAGDVDRVVSFYEPGGVIAEDGGRRVEGREAIRAMASGFLKRKPQFSLLAMEESQAGDVALLRSQVTVSVLDPGGKQTVFHLSPTLVVRRQTGGGWLIALDRPLPVQAPLLKAFAIPTLPAADLNATRAFYERLGFLTMYFSPQGERGYLILTRGGIEVHFFVNPQLTGEKNSAGCYLRVEDADVLHKECTALQLPEHGAPSLSPIANQPWGMREFVLVDLNGNVIRIGHDLDA